MLPSAKDDIRALWAWDGSVRSRPVSRVLCRENPAAAIPLGGRLPDRSSDLPGSSASHAIAPLFGLAPDGVCRLPALPREQCALTALFHPCLIQPVPKSAALSPCSSPEDCTASRPRSPGWPSAVYSLLHCPSPRDARPLAGILLCGARTFLSYRLIAATARPTSHN